MLGVTIHGSGSRHPCQDDRTSGNGKVRKSGILAIRFPSPVFASKRQILKQYGLHPALEQKDQ